MLAEVSCTEFMAFIFKKRKHISPLNFIGTCDCVKGRPLLAYQMPHAVHLAE